MSSLDTATAIDGGLHIRLLHIGVTDVGARSDQLRAAVEALFASKGIAEVMSHILHESSLSIGTVLQGNNGKGDPIRLEIAREPFPVYEDLSQSGRSSGGVGWGERRY